MVSLRLISFLGLYASLASAVPAAPALAVPAAPALAGIQERRGIYDAPPPAYTPPTTTRPDGPGCKPPKPTSTDNCSTRTVCADYVNECGMMYGGCFPDCKPWPSFTKPPCPTSSTSTPAPTSTDNCSTRTVCADYINSCGVMYGGCFPDCQPWPSFTPPPCPSGSSTSPYPVPTSTRTGPGCERTICADYVNECGVPYGGCHPDCAPYPTYTPPPCY